MSYTVLCAFPFFIHNSIVPSKYLTAFPLIRTLSLFNWHNNSPPRLDICKALNSVLFILSAQKGTKVQCAEPVTGSSKTG